MDMNDFYYECTRDGNVIRFKLTGFIIANKIRHLQEAIISELKSLEGKPFKIFFDFRGLKALDPRAAMALKEIGDYLYDSSAIKVGTVFDNVLPKLQHLRLIKDGKAQESINAGRAKIFSNADECLAWLEA